MAALVTWEDVEYRRVAIRDPRVENYLLTLRKLYSNGGAFVARFVPVDVSAFKRAASDDRRGVEHRLLTFLTAHTVRTALPEQNGAQLRIPKPLPFQGLGPLSFEGALADLLLAGGAYHPFTGTLDVARRLAYEFCELIYPTRHRHCHIDAIFAPWSTWFKGVAWDSTFLLCDEKEMCWTMICATDTD